MKALSMVTRVATLGGAALLASCSMDDTGGENRREAVLTVQGTNTEAIRSAPLPVSGIDVWADGTPLQTKLDDAQLELAGDEESVARFSVPSAAKTVRITLTFDDFGGFEATNGEAGIVDARGTRLNLELPASELVETGKVQLALDLERSLVARGPDRVLTPHFAVTY